MNFDSPHRNMSVNVLWGWKLLCHHEPQILSTGSNSKLANLWKVADVQADAVGQGLFLDVRGVTRAVFFCSHSALCQPRLRTARLRPRGRAAVQITINLLLSQKNLSHSSLFTSLLLLCITPNMFLFSSIKWHYSYLSELIVVSVCKISLRNTFIGKHA